jgi:Mrp family chromosome partitioning ATPase
MLARDQTCIRAYQLDTTEGMSEQTSSRVVGMPAGAHSPHVLFPPSATFTTDSMETSEFAEGKIRLPGSDLPESTGFVSTGPVSTGPVSIGPDAEGMDALDQVARENRIAIGMADVEVPMVEVSANSTPARRPLSEFVATEPIRQEAFSPALEVDHYGWPEVCEQLADGRLNVLDPVVEAIQEAAEQGQTLIGFVGAEPQAGCTTMLLSVAHRLATQGMRVAVVDADFATAAMGTQEKTSLDLASQLGLVVAVGWEDILAGRVPLAEGVIQSVAEPIAVLPLLRQPHSAHESLQVIQTHGIQASITAGVLRCHYEVVLVDLGSATEQVQISTARAIVQHCRLDATVIVTRESTAEIQQRQSTVSAPVPNTVCLGVIENWVEVGEELRVENGLVV